MGLRRARCLCGYPGEYETIYGVVSYMTMICMMWWGKGVSSLVGLSNKCPKHCLLAILLKHEIQNTQKRGCD
jgi:hypothetical protein